MYQEGAQSRPLDFNVAVRARRTRCVNLPRQPCTEGFTVVSLLNELRGKATVENKRIDGQVYPQADSFRFQSRTSSHIM